MCGIVGYVGSREATEVVVSGLQRLEYRGYDSAGIAILNGGEFQIRRSVGKLSHLQQRLQEAPTHGHQGIGHTRWATHGGVTEVNAHPHRSASGDIVVIQNGIFENYLEQKGRLIEAGVVFESQTDTEVIAHLIERETRASGDFLSGFRRALQQIRGGNAIVAMHRRQPGLLLAARLGNAGGIVIGLGEGENFIASDIPAILDYTQRVIFLEDGEIAIVTAEAVRCERLDGTPVSKQPQTIRWDPVAAAKGGYKHFMQKEIFEQPRSITDTLHDRIDVEGGRVILDDLRLSDEQLRAIDKIYIVACGTAWHAGLVAKFLIEALARVRVEVDYGSEFRYRDPILDERTLMIAITQSGETVDTLVPMELARQAGVPCLGIVNVVGSQAARLSDGGVIYLNAGPEIAVASTKVFTCMVVAAALFALKLGEVRGCLDRATLRTYLQALLALPNQVGTILQQTAIYEQLAERYRHTRDMLFLGRGINYPIALEGALKLKEISYIHAEGYPAGEMKHGPIALIDEEMPVVCIAVRDHVYDKMLSNVEQVKTRGGEVIAIVNQGDSAVRSKADVVIEVPETLPLLSPVLTVVPLQLLSYYCALRRGADVDQPRNLAKSVTVE
ncbi:glutamine--fructose-6-phosphate transaminase (isomerizing) [Kallotenue papyrolyticum]|uniref:glutamine--fructose-6-phosphate transaminase (isomerizing) n=1 Tax=Kallotenue papyrolyticum TaxID=1325125 RepID=UPI00049269F1|nr:glutamine--fructose-6-phosphate transaminase (isomerizing) [Kallotenue papyrolyticum]